MHRSCNPLIYPQRYADDGGAVEEDGECNESLSQAEQARRGDESVRKMREALNSSHPLLTGLTLSSEVSL
jgi:hypothetical protein